MNPTCLGTFWSARNDGGHQSFRIKPRCGRPRNLRQCNNLHPMAPGSHPKASNPRQIRSGRIGTGRSDFAFAARKCRDLIFPPHCRSMGADDGYRLPGRKSHECVVERKILRPGKPDPRCGADFLTVDLRICGWSAVAKRLDHGHYHRSPIAALAAFAEWEEWLNLVAGFWAIASPWVLGFQETTAMTVHVVIGVIVAALAAAELWMPYQNPPRLTAGS